jgi:hypothetical protein
MLVKEQHCKKCSLLPRCAVLGSLRRYKIYAVIEQHQSEWFILSFMTRRISHALHDKMYQAGALGAGL